MGKKKKNGKDERNEEKKDDNYNNKAGGGGGGGPVVLNIEMHCRGCAKKLTQLMKGFQGVEDVSADGCSNKVTVAGKMDPLTLKDKVESKTKKRVHLISQHLQRPNHKHDDQPKVTTVAFKTRLHCHGCTQRIRNTILKIKGVDSVSVDNFQDLVTVKGSMDAKEIPSYLKMKHNITAEIYTPSKKEGTSRGDTKKNKTAAGGGHKDGGDSQDSSNNKIGGYGSSGCHCGYGVNNVHPPMLFSDDNPNACFIM